MSRSIIATASVLALATCLPASFAVAKVNPAKADITVSGPPRLVHADGPDAMAPRAEYVDSAKVDTAGLDLRSKTGQAALEKRVRMAAYEVCDRLVASQPTSEIEIGRAAGCATVAEREAQPQVKHAISLAEAA